MKKLTCAKAKQIDLVEYLSLLGHHPTRVANSDYWFLSPLKEERTASFKVNRNLNIWYDHAIGEGGNFIDFGIRYFACSISELLRILTQQRSGFSFQQPVPAREFSPSAGEKKEDLNKILVLNVRPLTNQSLLDYLVERKISIEIAERVCKEVDFTLYDKKYTVIAFENTAGGYELRSRDFKGSSSPKAVTLVNNRAEHLTVFEGFFDYLSFLTIHDVQASNLTNFLVLNSLSFFEKSKDLMEDHQHVHLYLDRDIAGTRCTLQAIGWNKEKYIDHSSRYGGYKDLNKWLTERSVRIKSNQRFRRGP
jgi:Toprim-like/CHC2 zinc finger